MNKACCLDCEKRFRGCHSTCEDYLQYKQKLALIKERKQEERQKYARFNRKKMF